jgi:hypothetical protein
MGAPRDAEKLGCLEVYMCEDTVPTGYVQTRSCNTVCGTVSGQMISCSCLTMIHVIVTNPAHFVQHGIAASEDSVPCNRSQKTLEHYQAAGSGMKLLQSQHTSSTGAADL